MNIGLALSSCLFLLLGLKVDNLFFVPALFFSLGAICSTIEDAVKELKK